MNTLGRMTMRPVRSDTAQPVASAANAASQHIRGSSLLLAGQVVAFAIEFASQVLLVRYLAKSDFGAFSYALSIVVLFKNIAVLELPDTLARFIPVYRERRAYGTLMGSIALGAGAIASVGLLMAAGIYVAVGDLGLKPTSDPLALALLVSLVLMIPIEGLTALLTALFATLAGAAQIAFRQILAPVLKFGVVLAMMLLGASVHFLALGYVVVAALGLLIYALLLLRLPGEQTWLSSWRLGRLSFPAREIFGFSLPLLASTLVWLLMESSDSVLLGFFRNTDAVASFRSVLPVPRMLALLTGTFAVLYTPLAARMYARGERQQLGELYRRVALWMTVVSFPIFALAFGFSEATTTTLFGSRYADSAPIMAILAIGYYFFALTGLNGLTLKIYGKLRYAVAVDIIAAILNLAVNLVLVQRWGALGVAVGTTSTLVVHNALKQYGLWRYMGVNLFRKPLGGIYGSIVVVALALLGLGIVLPATLWFGLPLSALASLLVLWMARGSLQLDSVFPELETWPVAGTALRWFLR